MTVIKFDYDFIALGSGCSTGLESGRRLVVTPAILTARLICWTPKVS